MRISWRGPLLTMVNCIPLSSAFKFEHQIEVYILEERD